MIVLRPVSVDSLASIPWMSAKSLSHTIREVSARGPNDGLVWEKLMSRADMIAHSFTPKQAAMVLNSLGSIVSKNPGFVNPVFMSRFSNRFVPQLLAESNSLDIAQMVNGLGRFCDLALPETVDAVMAALPSRVAAMDAIALSMTAAGLSRFRVTDKDLVLRIFHRGSEVGLSDQGLSQLLHLAATAVESGDACMGDDLVRAIDSLVTPLADRLETVSKRTLAFILNSLTRLKYQNKEVLTMLAGQTLPPRRNIRVPFGVRS